MNVRTCAQLARLAYPPEVADGSASGIPRDEFHVRAGLRDMGLSFLGFWRVPTTETEFFIARDPHAHIFYVALRGTTSLRDIATDLRAIRHKTDIAGEWVQVHRGFYRAAISAAGVIATQSRRWPGDRVVLVGHSLGGALAIALQQLLPARYLPVGRSQPIEAVTFGAPRVGCRRFAALPMPGIHRRVYHPSDPVTWLPGSLSRLSFWPRYVHTGAPLPLLTTRRWLAAHAMAGYLDTIVDATP